MRFDTDHPPALSRLLRRSQRRWSTLVVTGLLLAGSLGLARAARAEAALPPVQEAHAEAEGTHPPGFPPLAQIVNFVVLVGVLTYFLRTPLASYLSSRATQIREDLVTAADTRTAATAQLADIARQLSALPAELEALRARGAEDVVAERGRIEQAAAAERDRLLAHTRREIEMQLRVARRGLLEYAAQLAVDVARARITRTITPDDQLRLVDRYAAQLTEAR